MKYNEIRPHLKTLDIALFSGKGRISEGIKFGTMSRWSHVGLIVVVPDVGVLLAESTTLSNIPDVLTGDHIRGVQLVNFSMRIDSYNGDIGIRHLTGFDRTDCLSKLKEIRQELHGRPYEKSRWSLIKSAYDGPGGRNTEDLQSIFCSEFVAYVYKRFVLLNDRKPSSEYTPANFSKLSPSPPAQLGPIIELSR